MTIPDPPDSDTEVFGVEYLDPETVGEVLVIKERVEEIESLHREMCKAEEGAAFSYRKLVYDDDTAEVICVCDNCGMGEVAAVCERTPDGPEWSIVRDTELN